MYDSAEELIRKIRLGEDTSLELKAVAFRGDRVAAPERDDLADEIGAMANTADGVLVLGVDDKTRDILGMPVDRLETVERFVFEICNDSIRPPVAFRTLRMEVHPAFPWVAGGCKDGSSSISPGGLVPCAMSNSTAICWASRRRGPSGRWN